MRKIFSSLACVLFSIIIAGCGGGGGGRIATPGVSPQTPASKSTTVVSGTMYIDGSIASRKAGKAVDPFLSKLPVNKQQELDPPTDGFIPLADATITAALPNGKVLETKTDNNGKWTVSDIPEGTVEFTVSKNGENADFPVTTEKDKTLNFKGEVSVDDAGDWVVNGEAIHDDGSDGYKKETHEDGTSDTLHENGNRDHHGEDEITERDLNNDGIVDQKFKDKNDDGVPDGPVTNVGGDNNEPDSAPDESSIDNEPPIISDLQLKDSKGKNKNSSMCDESGTLELDTTDSDGDATTVKWTVYDAEGNDVTAQYLNSDNIVAPTFSPPAGECAKPGAYEIVASVEDANGGSTEKDILITIETEGNKPPSAHIKANKTAGEAPLTVNFECVGKDTDGTIASYCWDFDKSNGIDMGACDSTSAKVTRTYISPGKYRATCIVTDNQGAIAIAKRVVVVKDGDAVPDFSTFTPDKTETTPGVPVVISVDPDVVGDSIEDEYVATGGSFTDSNSSDGKITWTPPAEGGEFVIEVIRTREDGEQTTERTKITVDTPTNKAPHAEATATPATGGDPLTVQLGVVATDEDGTIVSVEWDFNDRNGFQVEKTGTGVSVKYGTPGKYTATVKACDDDGACAYDKVDIIVTRSNRAATVLCHAGDDSVGPGGKASLFVDATDDDYDTLTYSWGATSGTLETPNEALTLWTAPQTPGVYVASVAVSDGKNNPSSCQALITVEGEPDDGSDDGTDDVTPPGPPISLKATGEDSNVHLTWEPSTGGDESSYVIFRDSGTGFVEIARVPATTPYEYDDEDVTNGTEYTYYVKAVDDAGNESDPSNEATATPDADVDDVITLPGGPEDPILDPDTEDIVISIPDDDMVIVVDPDTGTVNKEIPVGDNPEKICQAPGGGDIYVVNKNSNTISVIGNVSWSVEQTISIEMGASGCSAGNGKVYISNENKNTIQIFDPSTWDMLGEISVGDGPVVCGVNEGSSQIYVANKNSNTLSILDGINMESISEVSVGMGPNGCAVSQTNNMVYVSIENENRIEIVNGTTGQVAGSVDVGDAPKCGCSVVEKSNQIIVTNKNSNTITIINGDTKQVTDTINTGEAPSGSCANEGSNAIYITNKNSNSISIIRDKIADGPTDVIPPAAPAKCQGAGANAMASLTWDASDDATSYNIYRDDNSDGVYSLHSSNISTLAYEDSGLINNNDYSYKVTALDSSGNESSACGGFDVIPISEIADTVNIGGQPGGSVYCEGSDKLFVVNKNSNSVNIFDQSSGVSLGNISVGDGASSMCAPSDCSSIYVSNSNDNTISVINGTLGIVTNTVTTTGAPGSCVVNENTNEIYISIPESDSVDIVDMGALTVEKSLPVGENPSVCGSDPSTGYVYVTNKNDNTLSIIDGITQSQFTEVSVGSGPDGCAAMPGTTMVFITNINDNTVTVVNAKDGSVEKTIPLPPGDEGPSCSTGCGFDGSNFQLFISNINSNTVTIINGLELEVEQSLPFSGGVGSICPDEGRNQIIISNENSNTISIVNNPMPDSPRDAYAPNAPSGCYATGKNGAAEISWEAVSSFDLNGYNVYRSETSGSGYSLVTELNSQTLEFEDISITNNIEYFYEVRAVDLAGNESAGCDEVEATPDDGVEEVIQLPGTAEPCCSAETETYIFISNINENIIEVINKNTNAIEKRIDISPEAGGGGCCDDITADPVKNLIYITNKNTNKITVINGNTHEIEDVITVPGAGGPTKCKYNNVTNELYIINENTNEIVIMNPDTYEYRTVFIETGGCPCDLEADPTNNQIFVLNKNTNKVKVIDGNTYTVVKTILLGGQDGASGLIVGENVLYVLNENTNEIKLINTTDHIIYRTVTIPGPTTGFYCVDSCLWDPNSRVIYIINKNENSISIIDTTDVSVIDVIEVGDDPSSIVTFPGDSGYVIKIINRNSNSISIILPALPGGPSDTTPPSAPTGLVATSDSSSINLMWTASPDADILGYRIYRSFSYNGEFSPLVSATGNTYYSDSYIQSGVTYFYKVSAIDTSGNESAFSSIVSSMTSTLTSITAGDGPVDVIVDESRDQVYIVNSDSNNVYIYDANSNAKLSTAAVGFNPLSIDVSSNDGRIFVPNSTASTVSIISPTTYAVTTNGNGFLPTGVSIGDVVGKAFVSDALMNYVSVYSLVDFSLTTTIPTGLFPTHSAVNEINGKLYVVNSTNGSVTIINAATNAVITTVTVGSTPIDVDVNETTGYAYVASKSQGTVSVINGTTNVVTATIAVGDEPAGIGIDESRNIIYVANSSSGTISVIDGSIQQVVATIDVGNDPWGVGVHESLNKLFIPILSTDKMIVTDGFNTVNDNCNAAPVGSVACCGEKVAADACNIPMYYEPVCGSNGTTYTNGIAACCFADYYYPGGACD